MDTLQNHTKPPPFAEDQILANQETVKVAAVQAAPVAFDLPKSLRKVAHFAAEAAKAGADLVVFPEGFPSAYPWRYALGATVDARRQWFAKHYDAAVAIPSPEFEKLARAARENHIFLSLGIIEKEHGRLYCTAVLIDRAGTLLYRHRKLMPTAAERIVWGRGSGSGLTVAATEIGKAGGLICWENYMPAARLALYQKGIEIYIIPNADDLPSWFATMQLIAKEGRCFVITANQFCKVSNFPSDYPPFAAPDPSDHKPDGTAWSADDVLSHGGSCVIGPRGTFLVEPVWDKEGIVYAELKRAELTEARMEYV